MWHKAWGVQGRGRGRGRGCSQGYGRGRGRGRDKGQRKFGHTVRKAQGGRWRCSNFERVDCAPGIGSHFLQSHAEGH